MLIPVTSNVDLRRRNESKLFRKSISYTTLPIFSFRKTRWRQLNFSENRNKQCNQSKCVYRHICCFRLPWLGHMIKSLDRVLFTSKPSLSTHQHSPDESLHWTSSNPAFVHRGTKPPGLEATVRDFSTCRLHFVGGTSARKRKKLKITKSLESLVAQELFFVLRRDEEIRETTRKPSPDRVFIFNRKLRYKRQLARPRCHSFVNQQRTRQELVITWL